MNGPAPPDNTDRLKLTPEVLNELRCPRCRSTVEKHAGVLICGRATCGAGYPVVGGVPILIDETRSLFSATEIAASGSTPIELDSPLRALAKRLLPTLSASPRSRDNFDRFVRVLQEAAPRPRVLVLGGHGLGRGMEPLANEPNIELVETDVALGGRTRLVCDAHDLPFADGCMDGVVVQAVLEHVVDPARCVSEIHRVLKDRAIVYAETPFMQQVHLGRYDFTRFTPLGHRRLFREFDEIASGSAGGPGVALGWSYLYFLRGFAKKRRGIAVAAVAARLTGFWLKYFDRMIIDRPGAQDGTWGYYFLGRRSASALSDRELIAMYRGLSRP